MFPMNSIQYIQCDSIYQKITNAGVDQLIWISCVCCWLYINGNEKPSMTCECRHTNLWYNAMPSKANLNELRYFDDKQMRSINLIEALAIKLFYKRIWYAQLIFAIDIYTCWLWLFSRYSGTVAFFSHPRVRYSFSMILFASVRMHTDNLISTNLQPYVITSAISRIGKSFCTRKRQLLSYAHGK